jgi:hypothetical protein
MTSHEQDEETWIPILGLLINYEFSEKRDPAFYPNKPKSVAITLSSEPPRLTSIRPLSTIPRDHEKLHNSAKVLTSK